jgi:hypothetical protein
LSGIAPQQRQFVERLLVDGGQYQVLLQELDFLFGTCLIDGTGQKRQDGHVPLIQVDAFSQVADALRSLARRPVKFAALVLGHGEPGIS